jgi:hypothetical protein
MGQICPAGGTCRFTAHRREDAAATSGRAASLKMFAANARSSGSAVRAHARASVREARFSACLIGLRRRNTG